MKICLNTCFLFFFTLLLLESSFSSNNTIDLDSSQQVLKGLQDRLFNVDSDTEREQVNQEFLNTFRKTLNTQASFAYEFDSLDQIARLTSSDKKVKIINWDFPLNNGTFKHYGFVQVYDKKKGKLYTYELNDHSDKVRNPSTHRSDHKRWYGMLYYKIITQKTKRNNSHYLLLGVDANNKQSRKKIIDVLNLSSSGKVSFGNTLFTINNRMQSRVIFEYSAKATMSLKYEEKNKRFVFDHLSPPNSNLKGVYSYYGPDFTYDAMQKRKKSKKWEVIENIIPLNKARPIDKLYKAPPKSLLSPK